MKSFVNHLCVTFSSHASAFAIILILACCGCGSSGPTLYEVTGNVTLDGKPLAEGEIIFRDAEGNMGSSEAKIVGGDYQLQTTAGKKRVEITARKEVSTQKATSGEPAIQFISLIPAKYNLNSELTADVQEAGTPRFDFELTK